MSTFKKSEKESSQSLETRDGGNETLDDIFRHLGAFGRINVITWAVCFFISAATGFQNLCPVFTLNTPPHRCQLPGVANDTYAIQNHQHARAVQEFIPLDENGDYEACFRWEFQDGGGNATDRSTVACTSWVYDDTIFTRTLATDLDLVCDKKILRSTSSMLLFAGKFFGAILQGFASDRFGRRPTIIICTVALLACSIGNGFVNNVTILFTLRFLTGLTTTSSYLLAYVLCVEFLEPRKRTLVSTIGRISFAGFQLLLTPFAYFIRDWQHFQLALVFPSLIAVLLLWFLVESPRWLLSKGRDEDAVKVLKAMTRINNAKLSDAHIAKVVYVQQQQRQQQHRHQQPRESAINLFRVPRLAVRWSVLYTNWIVITAVYYGLTLNVSNMGGNIFVNYPLMTSVDVLSTILTGLVVNRVSRKYFHVAVMMVSGLVLISTFIPVITVGQGYEVMVLSLVGKMTISTAFFLVYIYSAELFPTSHRSFGMGSCSMWGRLGGIAAPYLADLALFVGGPFGKTLPQMVCGVSGILGGVVALVLPETRGRPLPETIEDAKKVKVLGYTPPEDHSMDDDSKDLIVPAIKVISSDDDDDDDEDGGSPNGECIPAANSGDETTPLCQAISLDETSPDGESILQDNVIGHEVNPPNESLTVPQDNVGDEVNPPNESLTVPQDNVGDEVNPPNESLPECQTIAGDGAIIGQDETAPLCETTPLDEHIPNGNPVSSCETATQDETVSLNENTSPNETTSPDETLPQSEARPHD